MWDWQQNMQAGKSGRGQSSQGGQSKGHTYPPRPGISPALTPPYQIPPSELVPANYAGQPVEGRGSHLDKFPD